MFVHGEASSGTFLVALRAVSDPSSARAQSAIPVLRGTWKGESESIILGPGNPHHAAAPSAEPRLDNVPFTMTIDKQDGRRFSGTFSSARANDKFVAVISRNNAIFAGRRRRLYVGSIL